MGVITTLANHFLIAMPSLIDNNFKSSVIYLCENRLDGSIGLIINHPMQYPLQIIFNQLKVESHTKEIRERPLLFGGPLSPERGFVIHRPMGEWRSSLILGNEVTVTTSNDIIHAIATKHGPQDALVTLGYAGWTEHQLEKEIRENAWLVCPFHSELLYEVPFNERWKYAGSLLGVNMDQIATVAGHT